MVESSKKNTNEEETYFEVAVKVEENKIEEVEIDKKKQISKML